MITTKRVITVFGLVLFTLTGCVQDYRTFDTPQKRVAYLAANYNTLSAQHLAAYPGRGGTAGPP